MFFLQRPLYFGCNGCGACCREFFIPLSHHDILRLLAAHTEMPLESLFLLRPADPSDAEALLLEGQWWHLLLQRQEDACLFLQSDNRCGTYTSRPRACQTFPFELSALNLLQILPDAVPIYTQHCDQDKTHDRVNKLGIKQLHQQNRLGGDEFSDYRALVERWNRWANRQQPQAQTLAALIEMIKVWAAL